jgi:hypothetical protein
MISEARKRANKKWNEKNIEVRYERLNLNLPKGKAEEIKGQARKKGYSSTSKYIVSLVNQDIEKDRSE